MKTILITGASSGIGEGLALGYAEHYRAEGVHLFLTGRNGERLEQVSAACRAKGADVSANVVDVTDRTAMKDWVETLPALDIVIANAGVSGGFSGQELSRITDDYTIFDVNLYGVLNTVYPALPPMIERKAGQIVIISSLAGFLPMPSAPAYSASKVAVRFYGEALASKLKPHNIAVSVVCPGFIKSRMTDANDFPMPFLMKTDDAIRKIIKGIEARKPRIAFPWMMVLPLAFLAALPSWISRAIFACLPQKKPLAK